MTTKRKLKHQKNSNDIEQLHKRDTWESRYQDRREGSWDDNHWRTGYIIDKESGVQKKPLKERAYFDRTIAGENMTGIIALLFEIFRLVP